MRLVCGDRLCPSRQGTACSSEIRAELQGIRSRRREAAKPRPRVADVREVFDDGFVVVEEAWQQITRASKRFLQYQEKTDRELPIIRLTPRQA